MQHLIRYFPFMFGLLFLGIELYWNATRRNKTGRKTAGDRNSLRMLWVVIIVALVLGGFCTAFRFAAITAGQPYWYFAGMALAVGGLLLRVVAIRQLGKSFTVDVQIAEGQQLKRDGMYRVVRHPSYSGILLAFAGLALTYGNWVSLPVIVVPIFLAFRYRIRIEEAVLIGEFGEQYLQYCRETKRLIPFLY